MATNEAERYLGSLAERSFLKLWTVPNPFRKPGKELTDLLVAFGNDLVIFSDKASQFGSSMPLSWERWRRRTINDSLKQLKRAVSSIEHSSAVYLDNRASIGLPFSLPAVADQRLHLVAIARPARDPHEKPAHWTELTFDSDAGSVPFKVGPTYVGGHFVHIFDGESIEFLLTQLDTAPDFLQYIKSREAVLRNTSHLAFAEKDLFSTAISSWANGGGFVVQLPEPDVSGRTHFPSDLWTNYVASDGATLAKKQYANSRNVDLLVNHFHTEYAEGRDLHLPKPTYASHERAMRILASESRFARRLIADGLIELLKEEDNRTFWAATVPSPDFPKVRYVWLSYPELPDNLSLREWEGHILRHLRRHLFVARTKFGPETYVGIAVPNTNIKMMSYFICVMDGEDWSEENEAEAQHWKAQGVFDDPQPIHRLYVP